MAVSANFYSKSVNKNFVIQNTDCQFFVFFPICCFGCLFHRQHSSYSSNSPQPDFPKTGKPDLASANAKKHTTKYPQVNRMVDGADNYVPKFIQEVPWYYKLKKTDSSPQDAFAHQRNENATKDHGLSSLDGYDGKKDRWHGHADEEWDKIVDGWEKNKSKSQLHSNDKNDSDDTDYELELQELGLKRTHLKSGNLEDPLGGAIRDRHDVPTYILGINANEGGKIRYGKDSLAAVVHQDSEFVRESKDEQDFRKIQAFAWEKNEQHKRETQRKQFYSEVSGEQNKNLTQANLDYVVEASPTFIMMKAREKEQQERIEAEKRLRKLREKYGI